VKRLSYIQDARCLKVKAQINVWLGSNKNKPDDYSIFGPPGIHLLAEDTHTFKHCGRKTEIKNTRQKKNRT